MRSLRLLLIASSICALAAGSAFADKQDSLDEYNAKPWSLSDVPGLGSALADVNETEPNDTCPGNAYTFLDVFHGEIVAGDSDWVTFTGNAGDALTIGTDADGALGTVDTVIELYADDCVTMLTSNDDGGPGTYSLITSYVLPATGTYNLLVRGYGASTAGFYTLVGNSEAAPEPPANDTCATATVVTRCTTFTDAGSTALANSDYPLVAGSCTGYAASGGDVVYAVDLLVDDVITVTYTNASDASLYMITDCADAQGSCVIGADDTLTGGTETFTHTIATPGTHYVILNTYSAGSGGDYDVTIDVQCSVGVDANTWGATKALYR